MIEAIEQADVVVLSPGQFVHEHDPGAPRRGSARRTRGLRGPIMYAANVMTQPGETAGFTLSDHLRAIAEHVGSVVSDVLVCRERLPEQVLSRYCAEGSARVQIDREGIESLGVRVHRARLLPDAMDAEMRHDADRLALAVHDVGAEVRRLAR